MSESGAIRRAALVVAGGILLSRVLGFFRDVLMAAVLGRSAHADLYAQAFTIPDFLFFLMAGGYLSITLVPILSTYHAVGDDEGARRAFTAVFRLIALGLVAVTIAMLVAAGPVTRTVFPEASDIGRLVGLTRIALSSQVFFGLGTLLMAAQYSRQRFLIPTLAPLVYNLGIIVGGLFGWVLGDPSPESFLWGGFAGAAVGNFALQWWGARRVGMRLVPDVEWRHPAIGEYFVLALPLMVGQSVVALDEQWPRLFGQLLGEGATAGLTYARRMNMLPVGVIAQAAGVAAYPFLARLAAESRLADMRATVASSTRSAIAVAGLAAAGFGGLATPIIRIAFERGDFRPADTAFVGPLLAVYSISIPFWAAHQVYTRGFYALRRMWLPVGIGTAVTAATVPALLWAARRYEAPGVAVASTASIVVYTLAIATAWHRRDGDHRPVLVTTAKALVAAVLAGVAANRLASLAAGHPVAQIISGGVGATVVYVAAGRLVGLRELDPVIGRITRRLTPGWSTRKDPG